MTHTPDEQRAIAKAPERIWLLDWPDGSATWCQDPDPDGEHPDSVEYVRADRLAALEASLADEHDSALVLANRNAALEAERAADKARVLDAITAVRGNNAGDFKRSGAVWEAYDQAVRDCHEAARAALAKQEPGS